jgi:hypothetical protein
MPNVQHSSITDQHFTPPEVTEAAKKVMGGIALDPASSSQANLLVGADRIYTEADNGLDQRWQAKSVFLNPPGGKTNNRSNQQIWFNKLYEAWQLGDVDQAIYLGFQLSILRLCPQIWQKALPVVVPSDRLAFWTSPDALLDSASQGKADQCMRKIAAVDRHVERCIQEGKYIDTPETCLVPSMAPSHDQVIVYLPPRSSNGAYIGTAVSLFYQVFSQFGPVPEK